MIAVDLAALPAQLGAEIAVSDWIEITQARIDQFAVCTDDRQWIHIDPVRAAAESPFGTTIAHGFLTLSLVTALLESAVSCPAPMVINYGLNRVRFVTPVPAGSRVRARIAPIAAEPAGDATQVVWRIAVEREGQDKPCCIVEWIVRYYSRMMTFEGR
jgi:acyl dehydratase